MARSPLPFVNPLAKALARDPSLLGVQGLPAGAPGAWAGDYPGGDVVDEAAVEQGAPLRQYYMTGQAGRGAPFTDRNTALARLIQMANQRREPLQVADTERQFPQGAGWEALANATSNALASKPRKLPPMPGDLPPKKTTSRSNDLYSIDYLGGSGV